MTSADEASESSATALCKACGLCCTGHLFVWTKLRSVELTAMQSLGINVLREPGQRGFSQPCPLWQGQCTIYESPNYPRFCHTYKCKLLKEVVDENIPLDKALAVVQQTKRMIEELDLLLPISSKVGFRERLVTHLEYQRGSAERENIDLDFQQKADALLVIYEMYFGVNDLIVKSKED